MIRVERAVAVDADEERVIVPNEAVAQSAREAQGDGGEEQRDRAAARAVDGGT